MNVFDSANDLLNPRDENGAFVTGISRHRPPRTTSRATPTSTCGTCPTTTPGCSRCSAATPRSYRSCSSTCREPNGFGMYAQLTNEFDLGEQNALDYAGDPAGTQQAVNNIRNSMYLPGPSGLANNDDLGAKSSTFIWEMLGMYPENSGSDDLVFASPGFPHVGHHTCPAARRSPSTPPAPRRPASTSTRCSSTAAVQQAVRAVLHPGPAARRWTGRWAPRPPPGAARRRTPRRPTARCSRTPPRSARRRLDIQPGATATATLSVSSLTGSSQTVSWTANPSSGVTVSPTSGTLSVGASGTATRTRHGHRRHDRRGLHGHVRPDQQRREDHPGAAGRDRGQAGRPVAVLQRHRHQQ